VDAANKCGVRRFDSVTGGFGGCPMAGDELVSNLDTLDLVDYCEKNKIPHGLNLVWLGEIKGLTSFI
jgi:hydroxymethylglutaryl-CoA lyase